MLNTLGHFVKIRSVNGLPSMPPCEDLRMIAELACERQTFLLAHRRWGTFLLVKRPSATTSEEKRLPFAGYHWTITSFLNCLTLSPFNSCFGGYVSRSRLASSRCSNEKRIGNSSSSEREARRTLTPFIFSFAFGCLCHAGQKFQRLLSPFIIGSSGKIVRKLEKPTLKSL